MNHIKNLLIGMVVGVANVIPGVSAGTMAVILGIYDKLLNAITLKKDKLKENLPFLISIALGAGIGILLFSNIIEYLYEYYAMETSFTFIGIIIGSIPMIWRNASNKQKLKSSQWIPFIITFIIMVVMAVSSGQTTDQEIITDINLMKSIWLIVAGAISAFAMIIPGISGSFIMLTLGVYTTVIGAISNLDFTVIIPVGIGVLIGIVGGTQIVKVLLNKYRQATYLAILGLVVGSLFSLYPGFTFNLRGGISIILMVAGLLTSYYFSDK